MRLGRVIDHLVLQEILMPNLVHQILSLFTQNLIEFIDLLPGAFVVDLGIVGEFIQKFLDFISVVQDLRSQKPKSPILARKLS